MTEEIKICPRFMFWNDLIDCNRGQANVYFFLNFLELKEQRKDKTEDRNFDQNTSVLDNRSFFIQSNST